MTLAATIIRGLLSYGASRPKSDPWYPRRIDQLAILASFYAGGERIHERADCLIYKKEIDARNMWFSGYFERPLQEVEKRLDIKPISVQD